MFSRISGKNVEIQEAGILHVFQNFGKNCINPGNWNSTLFSEYSLSALKISGKPVEFQDTGILHIFQSFRKSKKTGILYDFQILKVFQIF